MDKTVIAEAEKLVSESPEVMLASINEEGYPRVCVLSNIQAEGMQKLYLSTAVNSTKARHFTQNPKASACVYQGSNSVTLTGTVKIVTDPDVLRAMWRDWFVKYYPAGIEDPNYGILEFTAQEATLCIGNHFGTIQIGRGLS